MKQRNMILNLISIGLLALFLWWAENNLNQYAIRILNLIAINAILGLSLNLIYGMAGMFSLGHAGFMAIGAYTSALLTITAQQKETMWILQEISPLLLHLSTPFWLSLIFAGLFAAFFGCLIALPVLRLGGDYLGIATLGFAEIIRILITNFTPITNGSLGIKGIPAHATVWLNYTCLVLFLYCMIHLMRSNFGNVLRAVRDDEIAARTMGIDTYKYRVLAFSLGCFGGGLGGALMGNLISTINPRMFMITQTYSLLRVVVIGGLGSMTGSILGAILVTSMREILRFVENPIMIGSFQITGIPGMRMVVFSLLLIFMIIFRREGIMGMREFSWDWLLRTKRRAKAV
jgi:branched-chain amino acid transport system permease protein